VRPDRKGGATTIVFRLSRPAIVRFTVVRVFPTCERVGAFRVRAHAGMNRIPFRGRLHGRALPEGTYRLLVRARGAGADAAALRIVVVDGPPLSADEVRVARNANACGSTTAHGGAAETALGTSAASGGNPTGGGSESGPATRDRAEGPISRAAGKVGRRAKTLGTQFAKAVDVPGAVHPLVLAALALSLLFLAVAAVPPAALASAHAEALAHKRFEIALAGTAALGAAVVVALFS
jgi:hypothetical protein